MSVISQDFINSLGYLYEEIQVGDQDFLNEDSEYYDQEASELVEDIFNSISLSMFSEGYSANTVLNFLTNSSENEILESYINSDVNIISEEIITSDFVSEQIEILEVNLGSIGKLFGKVASASGKVIKGTKGAVKKGIEKAATAGVDTRIGKQFGKSGDIRRTSRALEKLARAKALKQGINVSSSRLTPIEAKNIIKQARISKAIKGVKDISKNALLAGGGVSLGYAGAKLGSSNDVGVTGSPSPSRETTPGPSTPPITLPRIPQVKLPNFFGSSSSSSSGGTSPKKSSNTKKTSSGSSSDSVNAKYKELVSKDPEKAKEYGLEQWKKAHPKLAAAEAEKERIRGTRQSDNPMMGDLRSNLPTGAPTVQSRDIEKLGKGNQSLVDNPLASKSPSEDETKKKRKPSEKDTTMTTTTKEAYDILLDYLFSQGHVDTLEEANYIMMEMDENCIVSIVENYLNESNKEEEHLNLTKLQKIRKRNKDYSIPGEPRGQQTSNRRAERKSSRGIKKEKGEKSAFGTMRHIGGPYK